MGRGSGSYQGRSSYNEPRDDDSSELSSRNGSTWDTPPALHLRNDDSDSSSDSDLDSINKRDSSFPYHNDQHLVSRRKTDINDLPESVLVAILAQVNDVGSLAACARVSKKWNDASKNQLLWLYLLGQHYPKEVRVLAPPASVSPKDVDEFHKRHGTGAGARKSASTQGNGTTETPTPRARYKDLYIQERKQEASRLKRDAFLAFILLFAEFFQLASLPFISPVSFGDETFAKALRYFHFRFNFIPWVAIYWIMLATAVSFLFGYVIWPSIAERKDSEKKDSLYSYQHKTLSRQASSGGGGTLTMLLRKMFAAIIWMSATMLHIPMYSNLLESVHCEDIGESDLSAVVQSARDTPLECWTGAHFAYAIFALLTFVLMTIPMLRLQRTDGHISALAPNATSFIAFLTGWKDDDVDTADEHWMSSKTTWFALAAWTLKTVLLIALSISDSPRFIAYLLLASSLFLLVGIGVSPPYHHAFPSTLRAGFLAGVVWIDACVVIVAERGSSSDGVTAAAIGVVPAIILGCCVQAVNPKLQWNRDDDDDGMENGDVQLSSLEEGHKGKQGAVGRGVVKTSYPAHARGANTRPARQPRPQAQAQVQPRGARRQPVHGRV